jgi:hypothetical protein
MRSYVTLLQIPIRGEEIDVENGSEKDVRTVKRGISL